ncbi:secreted protein [Melampsora americana]|nr:secreted protein [Melampsora americana]
MKAYIILMIVLQILLQLERTDSVLGFQLSKSAIDEPIHFNPLERRARTRNVVKCKPKDRAPFGGLLQDCLLCAGQLAKYHLSCTMFRTCAIVIVEPSTGKKSKIEEMSGDELIYRVPQSLDSTCDVKPLLKFVNKTFKPTRDSQKFIGMMFFEKPLNSSKVQLCDQKTLKKFGYVKI